MRYFELEVKVKLKRNLRFREIFEAISKFINFSISFSGGLFEKFHKSRGLKNYVVSGFEPVERDGVYKKESVYLFRVRSFDKDFIEILERRLKENINNPNMAVTTTYIKEIKKFFIKELYSLTPVIVTTQKGIYWTFHKDGDILRLITQLHNNLERKYKAIFGRELKTKENFIERIEIKNQVPQTIEFSKNGKKIKLFGNKFEITPKSDEVSQTLAFIALGAGLGEKGSFGGGFCVGR